MRRAPAAVYPVWALILDARRRAGLTQAELAQRAGTSQAAVARYERARAMPDLDTLSRLIQAAGLELRLSLADPDHHDESLLDWHLQLTPAQRVEANRKMTALAASASRARTAGRTRPLVDA